MFTLRTPSHAVSISCVFECTLQDWDDNLAAQAQAWANQCLWQHGMLTEYVEYLTIFVDLNELLLLLQTQIQGFYAVRKPQIAY
jgi:hypothetical protein